MVQKTKLLSLADAETVAREATRGALAQHASLAWQDDPNLTLGTFFPDEGHYQFSLYLAAEKPRDGVMLTTATVNRITGLVDVVVHDAAMKQTF